MVVTELGSLILNVLYIHHDLTTLYNIEVCIKYGSLKKLIYVNSCDHTCNYTINLSLNGIFYKIPQLDK